MRAHHVDDMKANGWKLVRGSTLMFIRDEQVAFLQITDEGTVLEKATVIKSPRGPYDLKPGESHMPVASPEPEESESSPH